MDSDDERPSGDTPPDPNALPAAQLRRPARPWGTETPVSYRWDAEQQEIDAEQRDTLAAIHAAQLDERELMQDNREDLRNVRHDERDRAADERDHDADARDRQADLRDVQADQRELIALERDTQADDRDATADQEELESQIDPRFFTMDRQRRSDMGET